MHGTNQSGFLKLWTVLSQSEHVPGARAGLCLCKKGMLPCQTLQFHYGEEREVDVSCFFTFCCPSEQNKRVAPRTLIVVVLCHFRGAHRMLDFNRMLFLIFHSPDSYILCHKDMKIIIWVRFEGRWTFPAGRFRTAPVIGENVLCCKGVNWY